MKLRHLIVFLFFCSLVGSQYPLMDGISLMDIFSIPLFVYVLVNVNNLSVRNDIIARTSLVYSSLLLLTGVLNGTIANTIFINFSRNFIEACVAYLALKLSLRGKSDLKLFSYLSFFFIVIYLVLNEGVISSSISSGANFSGISSVLFGGRNGMAVTNLLLVILLTYHIIFWRNIRSYAVIVLFPFLIFNIVFSASRFSVISLILFAIFVVLGMRSSKNSYNLFLLLLLLVIVPYFTIVVEESVDADVMSYSSELLRSKITENADGGFSYRLSDLNFVVIKDWLETTPAQYWLLGDGISITHGVLSFTFCCTGLVGFCYFVFSHLKMILKFWRKHTKYAYYISFLIFIFFLNDIVTNSRFIIGLNTMIYMGMLAYFSNAMQVLSVQNNENNCLSR